MSESRELPSGWVHATVGDVAEYINGMAFKAEDWGTSGRPIVRIQNLTGSSNLLNYTDQKVKAEFLVPSGTILVSWSATLDAFIWDGPEGVLNQHIFKVLADERLVDTRYLFWALKDTIRDMRESAKLHGSTMKHINRGPFLSHHLALPPIAEQKRIVARLDELQACAHRAREVLDGVPMLLEQFRQSVLASAFRGDLTADWRALFQQQPISRAVEAVPAPVQPRGGKEATNTVIAGVGGLSVNDPGTPLPVGWAWVPLLRVARQETGHTPSRGEPAYWGGEVPWLGIKDAAAYHGGIVPDTFQHITPEGLANSSARLLPAGTVCLSRTASVGYVVMLGRDMATSQDFATWSCTDVIDPEYLMYAILSEGDEIRRFGKGSTHTTIYFPEIRALHVALAPLAEQKEIVKRIREAFARVSAGSSVTAVSAERIEVLDQSILAKAFRGELVPQDPDDEPASVLLERIRAEREAAGPAKGRRRRVGAAG